MLARPVKSLLVTVAAATLASLGLTVPASAAAPATSAPATSARATTLAAAAAADDPALRMPSEIPSTKTPAANDHGVQKIVQVGNTMIAGGAFASVSNPNNGTTYDQQYVFAFDATTGVISTTFRPTLNGGVAAIIPGPVSNTVFVAGDFTTVNGVNTSHVVLLNVNTGAIVTAFKAATSNGSVQALALSGNRLYIGGYFTKVGPATHGGLAALNVTTGALDSSLNVQLATRHNDSGSGAQGAVGAREMDVTPAGDRLIVVGNFKTADGLARDQVVMITLGSGNAVVTPDWSTTRYTPYCFNNAYDSYMRGVELSPDGSYFVITATGGQNSGSLCDSAARWETYASGSELQPTWVDYTGGDTLWGVGITDSAVFIGGHNRWMNNPYGSDYANQGAVPRPGLSALDPTTGVPLDWNPGRNPRGTSAYALYPTDAGVWVTSDTSFIGNRKYNRPRIAFFPYAGGANVHSTKVGTLPGNVVIGDSVTKSNVLYRVNTGGGSLQSSDNGPDWSADNDWSSEYRNEGSNAAGWSDITDVTPAVPAGTPTQIFSSERWDPSDGDEMRWAFPVTSGQTLQVRLYFANRCTCTSSVGSRVFNVSIDGQSSLVNYDIVADVGDQRGTMKPFDITSDGVVNIDFGHVNENPLINGIEIVRTGTASSTTSDATVATFDGSSVTQTQSLPTPDLDWSTVRGATMVGGDVFYGSTDNYLYKRSFDGTTFGPAVRIDPYNDPVWAGVDTGSGNTYDGVVPNWYGQLGSVTGMFYQNNRLYYTLSGDGTLYWRSFVPDSGIVSPVTNTVGGGFNWSQAKGMFAVGANVYVVSSANGSLNKVPFANGAPSGSSTVVNSPATGGIDWRGRALFLSSIAPPPPNVAPTASFTSNCTLRSCSFNAAGSTDSDGTISSYTWDFGDGSNAGSGVSPNHTYTQPGTYTVGLTVTDDDGAQASTFKSVTITNTAPVASFTSSCTGRACSFDATGSNDPDGTIASYAWTFGDTTDGAGRTTSHTYASDGSYSVTLTVTDNDGTQSSTTKTVAATTPNQSPTATFTSSCTNLDCTFDSAGSSDPDGTIASYSWNFGEGAPGSGATTSHTYTTAGTYTVTLTVTDNKGATGSTSKTITVTSPAPANVVSYRATASGSANSKAPSVVVPATAQVGDRLVMLLSLNNNETTTSNPTGVVGWTKLETDVAKTMSTTLFTKVVEAGDPGKTVTVPLSAITKSTLTVSAYYGTNGAPVLTYSQSVDTTSKSAHVTPTISAPAGSYVLSYWADKSATTTGWTLPNGVTSRAMPCGTQDAHVCAALADSGGTVPAGTYGGITASTNAASAMATMWSIVLRPAA